MSFTGVLWPIPQVEDFPLDVGTLSNPEEYKDYFSHMKRICGTLLRCHEIQAAKGHEETATIQVFMEKMLRTIEALRMKYTFDPTRSLKVDLSDSSFPHSLEIASLSADIDFAQSKLANMPRSEIIRQAMIDHMFEHKEEPTELMRQMGLRKYYESLGRSKMFCTFTPGVLTKKYENGKIRGYVYAWGCYDALKNRPHIYVLFFEQDKQRDALEDSRLDYESFLEVIRTEGSHSPDVGILALAIDEALESIHPKVLKKIAIGPIYGKYCTDKNAVMEILDKERDEFALMFSTSIVISVEQQVSQGFFSRGKVREIFHIPMTDEECFSSKSSKINKYLIAPHGVVQNMNENNTDGRFDQFLKREIITCNQGGEIYVR